MVRRAKTLITGQKSEKTKAKEEKSPASFEKGARAKGNSFLHQNEQGGIRAIHGNSEKDEGKSLINFKFLGLDNYFQILKISKINKYLKSKSLILCLVFKKSCYAHSFVFEYILLIERVFIACLLNHVGIACSTISFGDPSLI